MEGEGETPNFDVDVEGVYSTQQLRGSGGMLPQFFLVLFLIDALRLILGHSGSTSSQF